MELMARRTSGSMCRPTLIGVQDFRRAESIGSYGHLEQRRLEA